MQMWKSAALVTLGVLATLVSSAPASAQEEAQPAEVRRPFRGLFGRPALPGSRHTLDFTASVFDAYDDDVYADQGSLGLSPDVRQSGWFQGVEGGLVYGQKLGKYTLGADTSVGVTHYQSQQQTLAMYRAGLQFGTQISRHTSLSASESFIYSPEFRLGLFVSPTDAGAFEDPFDTVTPGVGLFDNQSYRTNTGVGLTHTFHDRTTIESYYSLMTATSSSREFNYVSQGAGVRYQRQLTRNASMRLGYGYGSGRYPHSTSSALNRRGVHNIDAGIDYGRALSVSRRTHFSFSTGSALYYVGQATSGGADRLNYALLGSATLNHEMGRTWTASLAYRRSVDYHEGFADPFLAQSVSVSLQGLLARRLSFQSQAAYSRGVVGAGTSNDFATDSADAGLQYALTRHLAANANYLYYRYNVPPGIAVDPRFPRALSRNGVRFGLSTSIPLIRSR